MTATLAGLVRAGVPGRAVRLTVRELVLERIGRGPLGAREVTDTVEATVRAACRLVHEVEAPDELVEIVGRAAVEAIRGHGGESARWLGEARSAATAVLVELAGERANEPAWRWAVPRTPGW
jgi:hypothetical protein